MVTASRSRSEVVQQDWVIKRRRVDGRWNEPTLAAGRGYLGWMPKRLDIPQFTHAASSHPFPIRLINGVGRLISGNRPFRSEEIWAAARKGGLKDLEPTPEAAEALEVLLDSLASNVRMNLVGQLSAKDDTVRLARTHLRIHRALCATPAVDDVVLPPPVFIVGWPRTGSTFLPPNFSPVIRPAERFRIGKASIPVPPAAGVADRRVVKLDEMLGILARIEPRYNAIHPMTSEATEECVLSS